jgi:hypothetical protein
MKLRVRDRGRPTPSGREEIREALCTRARRPSNRDRRVAAPTPPAVVVCAWHEDVQGPNVTHTICPRCLERMIDALDLGVVR